MPGELQVVELSDSFHSVWDDLAGELGIGATFPDEPDPGSRPLAIVIAAGGEEDRGLDLLLQLSGASGAPVFLVGGSESHRFGIEAIRRGAADYFCLPGDLDLLRRSVQSASERRDARAETPHPTEGVFADLIGESEAMRETISRAERILPHGQVTVLINGETGTGKEVLARALHYGGPRTSGPFVPVNCAAIPENLLESELFGHERGAFTGAHAARAGLFEEAHGGTLFLDEIGHLSLPLQGKLLRVLEEKRIRRVGANRAIDVDVRVIAATHRDLEIAVQQGEFRDDLFYRLNVVRLVLPPLRERGEDVEILAEHFGHSLADRYGLEAPRIDEPVRRALRSYHWPGNVRQLRHAVERALLLSPPGELDPSELIHDDGTAKSGAAPEEDSMEAIIQRAALRVLEAEGGNKSAAARRLDISRSRLQRILDGIPEEHDDERDS